MNSVARVFASALLVSPMLLVAACGSDPPKPQTANNALTAPPGATAAPDKSPSSANSKNDDPGKAAVTIDPAIVKACGISADAAHFDYDSSRVRAEDDRTLGTVATCFTSGPLKGRQLRLVGHADPRGDSEYNIVLGQARADAISRYLNTKGLSKAQTASTSRGAMDATGTDDAGWFRDRRVDLMLGQ